MFGKCIYFNLITLSRQITNVWKDEFSRLGLSPSHGYTLLVLASNEDSSQKDLSKIMELDASTITRFIDALDKKKLIKKTSVGKGARYVLTKEGKALSKKIKYSLMRLFGEMQTTFGESEFEHFVSGLQKARKILHQHHPV